MQTSLICRNCSAENPFYQLTCIKCSAYLRERIFNIDLWSTLSDLIVFPSYAFARIIQAEHKNFILLILFLVSVKFSINSIYLGLAQLGERYAFPDIIILFFVTLLYIISAITISSYVYKFFLKKKTRIKDNFSILTYSLFPHAFALLILFPIELILFGFTVFSVNPSPFIIKETVAYVMLGFETLFLIWAIFLSFMAYLRQSGDFLTAIIHTILFNFLVYGSIYITARYLFLL
jgi:hypothetical protein